MESNSSPSSFDHLKNETKFPHQWIQMQGHQKRKKKKKKKKGHQALTT
jgi:hypothetical protein